MQRRLVMIKIIKSEKEYEEALAEAYNLLQLELANDDKRLEELDLLGLIIEDYENKHFKILPPNPLEAIKFRLEQLGMSESELSTILGYRSRKSELFSGKRKLSLDMIRKLHAQLKIPAESLIAEY